MNNKSNKCNTTHVLTDTEGTNEDTQARPCNTIEKLREHLENESDHKSHKTRIFSSKMYVPHAPYGVPDLDNDGDSCGDDQFEAMYRLSSTDAKMRRILRILCIYWSNTISNTRLWEITGQMLTRQWRRNGLIWISYTV